MTASYALNPLGQATGLEYIKTTHCSSSCTWFSDSITPSTHGETLSQTSTLSSETYSYDNDGRLTQTQETPTGKGCTTSLYSYDEESNRTSLTTREPGSEGKCATEDGTTEKHTYDTASRLTDTGVAYETFGNTTALPASDAGGKAELTSTYYVDSQVASQTQSEEKISYYYDPAGRTRETVSSGKTASTIISHYSGPGEALAWSSEGSEKWTRNIPGIDGALDAIQTSSGNTVLQLHDLKGNIVATAALSETETKLLSTYNSTEFGVPTTSNPPKYSWLGADSVASELPSGTIAQDGITYVPQTGRPLQTQPVELPLPTNTITPYTATLPQWAGTTIAEEGALRITEAEEARRALEAANKPPGAIPTPEGGTEEYDPEGLASYKTTMNRAEELREDAAKGLAAGLLADLVLVGAAEGGAGYAAALEASAYSLEACVTYGKSIYGKAGSWGKKSHNYYYCEEANKVRSSPWY
jgi:hypothetical protein